MLRKTSVNTALLVAILFLQLTQEPPQIQAIPIQIAPAVAEPIAAAPDKPPATSAENTAAAPVAESRNITTATRDYSLHVNDPVAYYKAKERHLRTALMKRQ